jgi:DNA-binding Xre family transcriptional regulator
MNPRLTLGIIMPNLLSGLQGATMKIAERRKPKKLVLSDGYWLGTNIGILRIDKKMSKVELARLAGIPLRTLRMIENMTDAANPTLHTLSAIGAALGVKTSELFAVRAGEDDFQV